MTGAESPMAADGTAPDQPRPVGQAPPGTQAPGVTVPVAGGQPRSTTHVIDGQGQFQAGLAYAAHLLMHAIGRAHTTGLGSGRGLLEMVEPRTCCREAVEAMALGMRDALLDGADGVEFPEHEH